MEPDEAVIKFIEKYCLIPEGDKVGEPFRLADFQKKFIRESLSSGVRRAYLSIARKNGKTSFISAMMLAFTCCQVVARQNSQIISGAQSREQAALIFNAAVKMINLSPALQKVTKILASKKTIIGLKQNVTYKAISKKGSTAQGLSPVLAILDEVGQVRGERDDFVEAVVTSQGAYDHALLIAISTQAASDRDLFSLWIDNAEKNNDPSVVSHIYRADEDCSLLDREQWLKANPGLGLFRSERDLKTQLERAQNSPADEASCRNLLLNQRVSVNNRWLSPAAWKRGAEAPNMESLQKNSMVICGLDLSQRNDLTAAVFAWRDKAGDKTTKINLYPLVFTPLDGIQRRAEKDRIPYDDFVRNGQLVAVPGATISYEYVCEYLKNFSEKHSFEIDIICFDRWNIKAFRKVAHALPLSGRLEEVGQGFKDMSPRCADFMSCLLAGSIRHGNHPLLNIAAEHSIAVADPSGNIKLDKEKSVQKIDPLVAAVMAVYPLSDDMEQVFMDFSAYM